jgi:hypothetical protein
MLVMCLMLTKKSMVHDVLHPIPALGTFEK